MRCALQLRRPAEGLAAYQRLKRTLSILLGVAPSARSEALHLQLRSPSGDAGSGPG
jgi:DNA-binding SARP family transcriptional activator